MRLRKESDDLQEDEILLIANVSDALAHPVPVSYTHLSLSHISPEARPLRRRDPYRNG